MRMDTVTPPKKNNLANLYLEKSSKDIKEKHRLYILSTTDICTLFRFSYCWSFEHEISSGWPQLVGTVTG